jgi:uncharacterized membrane protein
MTDAPATSDAAALDRLPALHRWLALGLVAFTALLALPIVTGWRVVGNPGVYNEGLQRTPSLGGWLFLVVGALVLLYGVGLSVAMLVAAEAIRRRQAHSFCVLVAVLATFFFPLGTLLGFHAINVLTSAAARREFRVVTAADLAS